MSEIHNKDSIYFLYIPNKNGEFRIPNKPNNFTIIKITKVLFEAETPTDKNDYYTLIDESCQINALNRKMDDSFKDTFYLNNRFKYLIEYVFLSASDITFILKKIHKIEFDRYFSNKWIPQHKINQHLVFAKEIKFQNLLNEMYNFVIPLHINNTFSLNQIKYQSNHLIDIVIGETISYGYKYPYKIQYIKSFYISDFDFYDNTINLSTKYNYLSSLFTINVSYLYNGNTKLNYLTTTNVYTNFNYSKTKCFSKLNFIISNILNTKNKNIKYFISYDLGTGNNNRYH